MIVLSLFNSYLYFIFSMLVFHHWICGLIFFFWLSVAIEILSVVSVPIFNSFQASSVPIAFVCLSIASLELCVTTKKTKIFMGNPQTFQRWMIWWKFSAKRNFLTTVRFIVDAKILGEVSSFPHIIRRIFWRKNPYYVRQLKNHRVTANKFDFSADFFFFWEVTELSPSPIFLWVAVNLLLHNLYNPI